jgi:hypothetical protein
MTVHPYRYAARPAPLHAVTGMDLVALEPIRTSRQGEKP